MVTQPTINEFCVRHCFIGSNNLLITVYITYYQILCYQLVKGLHLIFKYSENCIEQERKRPTKYYALSSCPLYTIKGKVPEYSIQINKKYERIIFKLLLNYC